MLIVNLISLERYSRHKQKTYQRSGAINSDSLFVLTGYQKWGVIAFSWGLLFFSFLLPLFILIYYAISYFSESLNSALWENMINSLWLPISVSFLALFVALIVNFYHRLSPSICSKMSIRLTSLGYLMRFSAIAVGSVESSLAQVSPSLDDAARTLGQNAGQTMARVHFPLIKKGMLTAFILVFIESMKELPAALLLRPFNFETLATYLYHFVSDEMIEYASLPA